VLSVVDSSGLILAWLVIGGRPKRFARGTTFAQVLFRPMKKPTAEMKRRMCTRKRRYRTQGDALDAALLVGVERQRTAYRCTLCGHWHLAST
jgi:hypothetical protein